MPFNLTFGRLPNNGDAFGTVYTVNGKIGNVELNAADVGAASEQYVDDKLAELPLAPVLSVNGKIGEVQIDASDVGAATTQVVDDLRDYTDTQFTAVSNQINQLNIKTDTTNSDLAALSSQVVNLAIDVSENTDSITGLITTVETHTTQIGELNTGIGQLYEGMTTFQSEITDLQNNKLDASAYVQHFKGLFPSYAALTAAYPSAEDGDYAHIDSGSGFDRMAAIWDSSDVKWVVQGTDVGANTDEVPEGSQNFYFTNTRAIQAPLSLLTLGDGSQLVSTDSIVGGFGKLQTQLNGVPAVVRVTPLTGLSTVDQQLLPTDTVIVGFGKLQGQMDNVGAKALTTTLNGFSPVNSAVVSTDSLITGISKLQGQTSNLLSAFDNKVQATVLANYTIGLNTPVVNTDTLIISIGKLQSQITNIGTTVRATLLTGLVTSNSADVVATDSILVAMGKFQTKWNIIDTYVRSSPLTGITFPNSTILVTDTVVLGVGKCQGQINDIRNPTWSNFTGLINTTMHASIDQNGTRLEVCKINGLLWLRGWIKNTAIMPANTVLFSWNQSTWLIDITGTGLSSPYRYIIGGQTITPTNDPNAQYYLTAEQQFGVTLNGLQFRINADIAANNFTVIPPFCLGKAV